jgi:hypothetical protein
MKNDSFYFWGFSAQTSFRTNFVRILPKHSQYIDLWTGHMF